MARSKKVLAEMTAKSPEKYVAPKTWVSTGSTLFNLALTGHPFRGWRVGQYYNLIGDSGAGKTWLSLTMFAEAMLHPDMKDYRIILDNNEDGALMDFRKYFGQAVADRIELPMKDKESGEMRASETVEEFYDNITRTCRAGKPFIYVLDSENGLDSEASRKLDAENLKAREKNRETGDSYGDGKAKYHSTHLRAARNAVRKANGILVIVSQTRDNLKAMSFAEKTRAGGRALKFYAAMEIWLAKGAKIKVKVGEKLRSIGDTSIISVKKNRETGRDRTVTTQIYYDYGIDDVLSNIDWLLREKHWSKGTDGINAKEFSVKLSAKKLAAHIDSTGQQKQLARIVGDVWASIEKATSNGRKSKYV